MSIQRASLMRKARVQSEIPDSSLADIAFLLLIFFMVTTEFRQDRPRNVAMPEAEATERVDEKRRNVLHLWIDPDGSVFINDARVAMEQISDVVRPVREEGGEELVVAIRSDREVPYGTIDRVTDELREAGALRVNFATSFERGRAERR